MTTKNGEKTRSSKARKETLRQRLKHKSIIDREEKRISLFNKIIGIEKFGLIMTSVIIKKIEPVFPTIANQCHMYLSNVSIIFKS